MQCVRCGLLCVTRGVGSHSMMAHVEHGSIVIKSGGILLTNSESDELIVNDLLSLGIHVEERCYGL